MFVAAMLTLFGVDYFLNLTPHAILIVDFAAASILAYVISRLLQYLYNFQRYNKSAMRRVIVGEQTTQRANIDLKIQRSEAQKLALVAEKVNDAIIISTPDGKITWVNATFTLITGYSFEDAVGQRAGTLLDAAWTSASAKERISAVARTQRPIRVEIEIKTKSNSHIWVESSITPIFNEEGEHVLNIDVKRDISITKKTEMDLMQAKRTAEKALQIKTEFLATMSHEIRTPMNGIVGMSDLLSRTTLSDEQSQYVSVITESGAALLSIIDDILYFSKLEANKLALSIAPFSPKEMLNAIYSLLEPTATQKGLALALQISADTPPMLMGDKGRIRQIIVNLVGNAIKFTNTGHVTITASATPTPTGTIGNQIEEVIRLHMDMDKAHIRARAIEMLGKVGIVNPERAINQYPFEFSGGMRQRAMIAQVADDVGIMYMGKIVEQGPVREILRNPQHPYTKGLLRAIPHLADIGRSRKLQSIPGSVPNLFERPKGCPFAARCDSFIAGVCDEAFPEKTEIEATHSVRCFSVQNSAGVSA